MALMAMWEITITCRDGSRLRFTEQRGDPPQKGEIFEADVTDLTEHDAAFLAGWPAIERRKPITVRTMNGDGSSRLCCRLCIVRLGLRARELESCPYAFRSNEAFFRHLKKTHGLQP
jgi:hypothetical protein